MVYHTAWILLAMPFLKKSSLFTGYENNGNDLQHQQSRPPNVVNQATVKLGNSARNICSIAQKYRQVYGSFRLSPITATHCTLTAAVALLRIYPDVGEEAFNSKLQDDLAVCLEVLGELSVSWRAAFKLRRNLVQLIARRRSSYAQEGGEVTHLPNSHDAAIGLENTTGILQPVTALHNLEANPEDPSPSIFTDHFLPPFSFDLNNPDLAPNIDWDNLDLDDLLGGIPE